MAETAYEYRKAGGNVRKGKAAASQPIPATISEPLQSAAPEMAISTNGTSKSKAEAV